MNQFIELKLVYGEGTVRVRVTDIVAVENVPGDSHETVRLRGSAKAYEVLPGQFSLDLMANHSVTAGVRAL